MKPLSRSGLAILSAAFFAAQPILAFQSPLSPESIRDAYFLGKEESDRSAPVFAKYTRALPTPKSGPDVATIQFETPYLVIADQISQNQPGYLAPDVEKEFLGKPEICRVRVFVFFPLNDEENFTVQLFQRDKEIDIQSKQNSFLYSSSADQDGSPTVGIESDITYAAENIDPDDEATVRVTLDNGQIVETTFDLSQLK
jgi:hypothetical protein